MSHTPSTPSLFHSHSLSLMHLHIFSLLLPYACFVFPSPLLFLSFSRFVSIFTSFFTLLFPHLSVYLYSVHDFNQIQRYGIVGGNDFVTISGIVLLSCPAGQKLMRHRSLYVFWPVFVERTVKVFKSERGFLFLELVPVLGGIKC